MEVHAAHHAGMPHVSSTSQVRAAPRQSRLGVRRRLRPRCRVPAPAPYRTLARYRCCQLRSPRQGAQNPHRRVLTVPGRCCRTCAAAAAGKGERVIRVRTAATHASWSPRTSLRRGWPGQALPFPGRAPPSSAYPAIVDQPLRRARSVKASSGGGFTAACPRAAQDRCRRGSRGK